MRKPKTGFSLVVPFTAFLFFIYAYPIFYNFWLSFYRYDVITMAEPVYVGLENYQNLIPWHVFQISLRNTLVFALVSVALEFIIGLVLAFGLSKIERGRKVYTSLLIFSLAMPDVVTTMGWKFIFAPRYGVLNSIIGQEILWLANPNLALCSVIVADTWKIIPWFAIIFLASILTISPELYEALKIDGGGAWHEFRHLVIPHLFLIIMITLAMRTIDAFTKVFTVVYLLTGGGPGNATQMVPLLIYTRALHGFKWGDAATLSVLSLIMSIFLTAIYIRMVLKR